MQLREDENKKYGLEVTKLVKSKEILNKKMMTLETAKSSLEHEIIKNKYVNEVELKNVIVIHLFF